MKKVFIYVRVSTQEQANEGYSIGEQTERLKKYCDIMGWIVAKVYTDGGYTGANTDRPALKEMIKDVKAGKADKVLVYKLDRLSRSQKDTLYLIEDIFLENNTDFVSVNESFDTSTAFGRAMIGILAVFAQLEREQIKERMCMGIEARAKQGKFHGSNVVPVGYNYIDDELVINEFEAVQIRELFNLYLSGLSFKRVADALDNAGYTHKKGRWLWQTVKYVLSNELYIGYIRHKGNLYKGTHEPIIDDETFNKVQEIKTRRTNDYKKLCRRAGKISSYLGGYLQCACCSAKMSRIKRIKHKKAGTFHYYYYICNSRAKKTPSLIKDPNCKNKIWKMEELDAIVFNEIKKLSLDPNYIAEIQEQKIDTEKPKILKQEIAKIDEKISKLMDLFAVNALPIDVLQSKIHDLNDNKTRLEKELDDVLQENKKSLSQEKTLEIVTSFESVLKTGDLDEIRLIIGTLIEKVTVNNDEIAIYWAF